MNRLAVYKRKRRSTRKVLDAFERNIEPLLDLEDPAVARAVGTFKANVRSRFDDLAEDSIDLLTPGVVVNGDAIHLRDRLGEPRRAPEPIGVAAA